MKIIKGIFKATITGLQYICFAFLMFFIGLIVLAIVTYLGYLLFFATGFCHIGGLPEVKALGIVCGIGL